MFFAWKIVFVIDGRRNQSRFIYNPYVAKILIIDDEDMVRDFVKEVLAPAGHELFAASSGAEALNLLKKKPMDLLVVDRYMPGMSGIEVVEFVRHSPNLAKLKIIMCTGASVTKEVEEAFAAGADDYILKTLVFTQLPAKVAKVLALPPRAP